MFLDSLVGDAGWRAAYACDRQGNPLPWELHKRSVEATHPYEVLNLRSMLAVPYFEKALYELKEEDLTPENVQALADRIEAEVQGGLSARPLLSVPHLLSDEASCYYHGYVLAEMAVHQVRSFFTSQQSEGAPPLWRNPEVGPTLEEFMWRPGNSEAFLDLVQKLTGQALSSKAWVECLSTPTGDKLAADQAEYDHALAFVREKTIKVDGSSSSVEVDLDMRVRLVDGDEVIADSAQCSGDFLATCDVFQAYLLKRFPPPVPAGAA